MAKMYPPQISELTKSPGEIELFIKLKNDLVSDEWVVFHSLDIANHKTQRFGEIDFVILVPGKGGICVEVKAIKSIQYENGFWFLGQKSKEKRGPFKQVRDGMHSLQEYIWAKNPSLKHIPFTSVVYFPYVEFDSQSPEWNDWELIDSKKAIISGVIPAMLNSINEFRDHLKNVISAGWFDPDYFSPSNEEIEILCGIVRPNFEFYESPKYRKSKRIEELKKYTEEQFIALDAMELNNQVIFSGPAGTGKTLLAIELCRRMALKKKRTLLLCFNRNLGKAMEKEISSIDSFVSVKTIHKLMTEIAGISSKSNNSYFWEKVLPKKALESHRINDSQEYLWDVVILDEAQDLMNTNYANFINSIVKGGIQSGSLYIFGDFNSQNIYSQATNEVLQMYFRNYPNYSLRVNCRNTPRITDFIQLLGGLSPGYSKSLRQDNHIDPTVITYEDPNDQRKKLSEIINILIQEKRYQEEEIIILSPLNDEKCIASKIDQVIPFSNYWKEGYIKYCSIYSFKGLESAVIILTDVVKMSSEKAQKLFYTAISRAQDELIILIEKNVQQEIVKLISKGGLDE
jgi:hypothetical protein